MRRSKTFPERDATYGDYLRRTSPPTGPLDAAEIAAQEAHAATFTSCRGCGASLRTSDPDLCELCDLHAAERGLDEIARVLDVVNVNCLEAGERHHRYPTPTLAETIAALTTGPPIDHGSCLDCEYVATFNPGGGTTPILATITPEVAALAALGLLAVLR